MYNFRTVMGQSSYRAWKNWDVSDYLVGKFISEGEDNFGNPSYKVEVIEAGFSSGEAPNTGTIFSFNSSGALNKAMEEIQVNDIIKVIYKGEDTVTKGKFKGKKFHSMEVLVAPSNEGPLKAVKQEEDEDLI